jgi:hypothetical protein
VYVGVEFIPEGFSGRGGSVCVCERGKVDVASGDVVGHFDGIDIVVVEFGLTSEIVCV